MKPYKNYIGTFGPIEYPQLRNRQACILNTDNTTGIHWISLYRNKNDIYFYDSFGRAPEKTSIYFSNKNWTPSDNDPEQYIFDVSCGAHSIAFILCCFKFDPNEVIKFI